MPDPLSVSDADLRQLCRLISHDLRNPLAAIVTNLEFARRMLEQFEADPDLREAVRDSVTACDVLRRIVSNFDLLSKGMPLKATMQDLELEEVVRDVVRRCAARAEQACLRLALEAPGSTILFSDEALVALAVENLVDGSLQHAPADTEVSVSVVERDDVACVVVRDTGPPIDASLRDFALGVEAHTSSGRRDGTRYGRGLALLSARVAIEAIGGSVEASEVDGQSSIRLTIPRLR